MRLTRVNASLIVLGAMILVIATVLGFEHLGGFIPCALCLEQRQPFYAAMPLAALGVAASAFAWPAWLGRTLLALCGALMVYSAFLGGYHSGVEWGWWPGPSDCAAAGNGISANVGDLLSDLSDRRAPSCSEAAGRFLGLSFAGWNVLASLGIAAIALRGAMNRDPA